MIFFRLWYLQVLSSDKYVAAAQGNQLRKIKVQAPRGEIVDREGRVLVRNRIGLAVKITPDTLPEDEADRDEVYKRLAKLLGMRAARIERRVDEQFDELPFSKATVKQDVGRDIMMHIQERKEDYRGVEIEPVFLREYPHGEVGAHLFGYVGEVTQEQLDDDPHYTDVALGDRVGKAGIEAEYDRFLRGRNGATQVRVDAFGQLVKNLKHDRAQAGQAAAPLARSRRPEGGPAGARVGHRQGRLRRHGRAQRRGAGARLAAILRSQPVRARGAGVRLQAPDL